MAFTKFKNAINVWKSDASSETYSSFMMFLSSNCVSSDFLLFSETPLSSLASSQSISKLWLAPYVVVFKMENFVLILFFFENG